jgi:hypothetical protein
VFLSKSSSGMKKRGHLVRFSRSTTKRVHFQLSENRA